jgi:2-keto-4-pentenoate hydratase
MEKTDMDTAIDQATLADLLHRAHGNGSLISALPPELTPADADAAFALQHQVLRLRGARIGGWKVGSKSASGPIHGAPLPHDCVLQSGAMAPLRRFGHCGLELEIAFAFGRRFEPSTTPYSEEEVAAGVSSMGATIEIVASRFADWPNVHPLAQLADFQNHGALIAGKLAPYQDDYPFVAPEMTFTYNGANVIPAAPANTAGDPRRLLAWVVNHCTGRGIAVEPEMIVTAGTYTGLFVPTGPGTAVGRIAGLAEVSLTLA